MALVNGKVVRLGDLTVAGSVTADDLTATDDVTAGDDVIVGDAVELTGGGTIRTTANGDLILLPHGTGITKIGDAGAITLGTPTNDDLGVSGRLQVLGASDFTGDMTSNSIVMGGGHSLSGTLATRGGFIPDQYNQTVRAGCLATGTDGNYFFTCEAADRAFNFGHTQQTDPTLYIHSHNQATDEWVGVCHDATNAIDKHGKGGRVTNHEAPAEIADDGTFNLPTSSAGWVRFMVGDCEEYGIAHWNAAGTVVLGDVSANVVNTDTDAKFCIISGANPVVVKNRLAAAKKIMFDYHYTTP